MRPQGRVSRTRCSGDACARLLDVLEVALWNGEPQHFVNPNGAVRLWHDGPEGAGQVVYLIVDEPPEVRVLLVPWLGRGDGVGAAHVRHDQRGALVPYSVEVQMRWSTSTTTFGSACGVRPSASQR